MMDAWLELRRLTFALEAQPTGSAQQHTHALQLKCFLAASGVPETDRAHEPADAALDAGAPARRARLWDTVTHAGGLDPDFCIMSTALAELDLTTAILNATPLADLAEGAAAAREASAKAHAAILEYQQHQQQRLAPQATGTSWGGAPAASHAGAPQQQQQQQQRAAAGNRAPFRAHAPVPPNQPHPGPGNALPTQPQQPDATGTRWQAGGAPAGPPSASTSAAAPAAPSRWAPAKRPGAPDAVAAGEDEQAGPHGMGAGGGGGAYGGGGAPAGPGGFQTAKAKLVADCVRNGQPPPHMNQAPRTGLTRPQKRQQTGTGGSSARGFVPPFAAKALEGPPGGPGKGGGGGGGEGEVESPYPPRLLEILSDRGMLSYSPEGVPVVPESLASLDPKIVENVFHEVLDKGGCIGWDDIAGQDAAKRLVQEIVVWPMLNPQLFRGARAPPRGLLLFGPPGTGKTLIGKAVASNISATFFAISASSLTSKWIGEGEKMVRALFALAGCLQPAVIFIDEVDSLLSSRKAEGEHEASRRLKTEMLIQLEGCDPSSSERRVLLIGATNRPEELDEAARRRMPKQLYIPLPCAAARRQMLVNALRKDSEVSHCLGEDDLLRIVERTAGYSGSDMKNLIQEACQGPVRDLFRTRGNVTNVAPSDLRPVSLRDFKLASQAQKRSVSDAEVERYKAYDHMFGAKYMDEGAEGAGAGGEGGDDDDW